MSLPIEAIKEISALMKKGLTLEAQEKIMELRELILELQEKNHDLLKENDALKKELHLKDDLEYDGAVYWRLDSSGDDTKKDGPFCPNCFDNNGKAIRIQWWEGDDMVKGYYGCQVCNSNHYPV